MKEPDKQPNRTGFDLVALSSTDMEIFGTTRSAFVPGDVLIVKTLNSVYTIRALPETLYEVSGGWYRRRGIVRTTIAGCTWGGSALKSDLVAACGMHLEFGNRVITSQILAFCHFRQASLN